MDSKIIRPRLSKIEHVIMAQTKCFQVLLEVKGNDIHAVLTFMFHSTIEAPFARPGNNGSLINKRNKIIVPIKGEILHAGFYKRKLYKGNKVNMLNMPGVGLTKVNRMLPSCPSSFHHKQALHCPDGHLVLFLSLISLRDLVLL